MINPHLAAIEDIPAEIGRYRIDESIGEGAMAVVYRAHDTRINRRVAIKVLKPELRHDAELVRRFLAESRAAGMLSHANIVTIHDVGEADGVPYIAMEYLDGEPLDMLIERQGRLTSERVLALGAQISSALALAHRHGVVHRDVKPSNIIICDKGKSVKLLDFGIARIDEHDGAASEMHVNKTQFGQIIGTPRYMSPEQAMGLPVDLRADLFSLGSILYEMVTGKPAFNGSGIATLAIQISQQPQISITSHINDCPRGLNYVINKLLSKKPNERFADAQTVQSALLRELESISAVNATGRRGLSVMVKMPIGLAAISALALTASIALLINRQEVALTEMAVASGSSTTEFIARNVALHVAENVGLPPAEQDWLPLQAFVEAASDDPNVRRLSVVDETGIVRASSQTRTVGTRADNFPSRKIVNEIGSDEFRFLRPIRYANANFGSIEMALGKTKIDAAITNAHTLLFGMAAFVVIIILVAAYFAARQLTAPLVRLRGALDDVADGQSSFRLSHNRADEFGAIFDSFNRVAAAFDDQNCRAPHDSKDADKTRIEQPNMADSIAHDRYAA